MFMEMKQFFHISGCPEVYRFEFDQDHESKTEFRCNLKVYLTPLSELTLNDTLQLN